MYPYSSTLVQEVSQKLPSKTQTQESGPVHDTAQTHWLQPRRPTGRPIHPIGHIALDLRPEQNASLKLADEDIVVSEILQ